MVSHRNIFGSAEGSALCRCVGLRLLGIHQTRILILAAESGSAEGSALSLPLGWGGDTKHYISPPGTICFYA
jgi:hypothetical protein